MDTIEDLLGSELEFMEFKRRILFYSLFALIYDIYYGLKSKLVKSKGKNIPSKLAENLRDANRLFFSKKVPERVSLSMTTRTSTKASRSEIFKYLKEKCFGR